MPQTFGSFVAGRWIQPAAARRLAVVDPATEQITGEVLACGREEVEAAVAAARAAFTDYAASSREARLALLARILAEYQARYEDVARAITADMGAPAWLAEQMQAATGLAHLQATIEALRDFPFAETQAGVRVEKLPVGVCALITPWNWPINQIACKVAPALAAGCTMVLKASELAPRSAQVWTEVMHAARTPPGVFNLVMGDAQAGALLAAHPDVDMVSITGSTRAGVAVAQAAAPSVKRVCQELGGKSPNIILDDAELGAAIPAAVAAICLNSGQSCNAPSRLLAPHRMMEDAEALARAAAERVEVGPPTGNAVMGPLASRAQWERVQAMIQLGLDEGARLIAGGLGRPEDLPDGFYARPTVFAGAHNGMRIAREEVFGPVLVMIGYDTEDEAVRLANDSPYGLAAYVQSSDPARAERVGARLRAGQVFLNGAGLDFTAPFGGFKQSGNGREWGRHGLADYLELRATMGCGAA